MSTRNPMNERYSEEGKPSGKTRKSAASAKPATKAASTVRDEPVKSKKQKKKEHEQREAENREKRGIPKDRSNYLYSESLSKTVQYKKLRRQWGVFIGLGIAFTILAWVLTTIEAAASYSWIPLIAAYVFIIMAFYIDWGRIRKLRNSFNQASEGKSKAARAQQKQAHAAAIEQRREAAELAARGEEVPELKESKVKLPDKIRGFFARL